LSLVVSRHFLKYFFPQCQIQCLCLPHLLTHSLTHYAPFLTPQFRLCPEKRKICVTEELRFLWNHSDHRNPPLVFVWSHVSIFRVLTLYLCMVHFNIIRTFMPGLAKWSPSYGFSNQNPIFMSLLSHACYIFLLPQLSYDYANNR
jgi:hypothetical protein